MNSIIKTLIVDDHAVFRAGLIKLLEINPSITIIGELDSGDHLMETLAKNQTDLVILDISLSKTNGLKLLEQIKTEYPQVQVLILTMHKVAEYCRIALKQGAAGYILKEDAFDQVEKAIEAIRQKNCYVSPSMTAIAAETYFTSENPLFPEILTKTEKVILEKIASGMSNKEVGENMGISVRTVETHRAHLLKKLKIKNTAGLVQYAIQYNLIRINKQ